MTSLRVKLRIIYAAWVLLGMTFGVLAVEVSELFIIALVTLLVVVGWLAMSLRCPACGARALYAPIRIGSVSIPFVVSWIPSKCRECNSPLA